MFCVELHSVFLAIPGYLWVSISSARVAAVWKFKARHLKPHSFGPLVFACLFLFFKKKEKTRRNRAGDCRGGQIYGSGGGKRPEEAPGSRREWRLSPKRWERCVLKDSEPRPGWESNRRGGGGVSQAKKKKEQPVFEGRGQPPSLFLELG